MLQTVKFTLRLRFKVGGVVIVFGAFFATSCGAEPITFPSATTGTGGVVVLDQDGDGTLSAGDQPVAGATIQHLIVDDDGGFRLLPRTPAATTNAGGAFVLPSGRVTTRADAGVQLGYIVPLENGQGEGVTHKRARLRSDVTDNVVLITHVPTRCRSDADVPKECPLLELPDLVPIVSRDLIDEPLRGPPVERFSEPRNEESTGLLPSETWFIEDDTQTGQRRLRFASLTANIGEGVLDVISEPGSGSSQRSWQRIWGQDLTFWDRPSGEFLYHEGHDHMHFDAFEQYQLLDANEAVVAESSKVSFCLRDSQQVRVGAAVDVGIFLTQPDQCGTKQQSINAGWGDHYNEFLPDQWIDITGVPPGEYVVEITVDPQDLILESDESNNRGRFDVAIS